MARFLAILWRRTAKLVVCTRRPLESASSIRGSSKPWERCEARTCESHKSKKSLTIVYDMCAAGTSCRVRFRRQQKRPESCGEQADWRENLLQVAKSCVGARGENHSERGNRGDPDENASAKRRVLSRGRYCDRKPWGPVGSGPVRDDSERESRGVMTEATEHHEVPLIMTLHASRSHQSPSRGCRSDETRKR